MATLISVGSILQVRAWTSDAEQAAVNTFYYHCSALSASGPDTSDFALAIQPILAAAYKPMIYNAATWNGVQVRDITVLPLSVEESNTDNSGVGTGGATGLPRQACGLLSWYTALAGPGGRGRTYLPFPPSALDTGFGFPSPTYLSALTTLAAALFTFNSVTGGGGTATVDFVLKRSPGNAFALMQSFVAREKWATQKRRGSYGRANVSPI